MEGLGFIVNPESWTPDEGPLVLGFPMHYRDRGYMVSDCWASTTKTSHASCLVSSEGFRKPCK